MNPKLDSRSLQLFCAVAESLSFRRAAQQLHMSQPPLSRAIRELEERLGTQLFVRDRKRVELTAAGSRLLPRARKVLRLLLDAEKAVQSDLPERVLRLGITDAVEPAWYAHLPVQWARAKSQATLQVRSGPSPLLVRMLLRQQLDAAFIALPTESRGLDVEPLEAHPLCVALATTHPLACRRMIKLLELAGHPVFWFERSRQPAYFDHCKVIFERFGFRPTLREPGEHHVLLAEVAAGKGAALLPSSLRTTRRRGVVYRPLREGDELAVGLGLATLPEREALRARLLRAIAVPTP